MAVLEKEDSHDATEMNARAPPVASSLVYAAFRLARARLDESFSRDQQVLDWCAVHIVKTYA